MKVSLSTLVILSSLGDQQAKYAKESWLKWKSYPCPNLKDIVAHYRCQGDMFSVAMTWG